MEAAELLQLLGEASTIRGVEPRHGGIACVRMTAEAAAGEYRLARRQAADTYGGDIIGVPHDEVAVDRLIVLSIITDQ